MRAACALSGLALLAVGAGAEPACRVTVEVDPARAFVGQQVRYVLRIERSADVTDLHWERNLSFPAFRAEWLPGVVREPSELAEGERFQVFEERRAIFPARPGRLVVPRAGLTCRTPRGSETVEIPATTIEVAIPPEGGRPPTWTGIVGPVTASLTLSPETVELGETVRVSLVLRGPANLWDAVSPLEDAFGGEALEIFGRPRELGRDSGRELVLRRYFTYDLVPRRTGTFTVPALDIPFFDPTSGRYGLARTAARRFAVTAPSPPLATPEATAEEQEGTPRTEPPRKRGPVVLVLTSILAAGVAAWFAVRHGKRTKARREALTAAPASRAGRTTESAAIRPAASGTGASAAMRAPAAGTGESAAMRALAAATGESAAMRALAAATGESAAIQAAETLASEVRAALASQLPDAAVLSSEELLERAASERARRLARLLLRLDRVRFAAHAPADEVRRVREELARTIEEPTPGDC